MNRLGRFILVTGLLILWQTASSQEEKNVFQTKFDSIKLALSYGSQAFDALDVTDAVLINEKSKVTQLMSMVDIKDSMRVTEQNANKALIELNKSLENQIRKDKRRRTWRSIKNVAIGVLIGGGVTYGVISL